MHRPGGVPYAKEACYGRGVPPFSEAFCGRGARYQLSYNKYGRGVAQISKAFYGRGARCPTINTVGVLH